jgi:hypothetical protein
MGAWGAATQAALARTKGAAPQSRADTKQLDAPADALIDRAVPVTIVYLIT